MESDALCGLGTVYHQMGEFSTALRYHQNDLEIAEQLGMPTLQSRACGNLGEFLFIFVFYVFIQELELLMKENENFSFLILNCAE